MRYVAIVASLAGTLVFGLLVLFGARYAELFIVLFALCAVVSAIGVWDILQTKHSLRRNYPILANIRFGLEKIRPEIRQSFWRATPTERRSTAPSARSPISARRGPSTNARSALSKISTATISNGSIIPSLPFRLIVMISA